MHVGNCQIRRSILMEMLIKIVASIVRFTKFLFVVYFGIIICFSLLQNIEQF